MNPNINVDESIQGDPGLAVPIAVDALLTKSLGEVRSGPDEVPNSTPPPRTGEDEISVPTGPGDESVQGDPGVAAPLAVDSLLTESHWAEGGVPGSPPTPRAVEKTVGLPDELGDG